MKKAFITLTLIVGAQAQGGINVATVGNDNNCDFRTGSTRIQDAIDDGSFDEIRLTNTATFTENLTLDDVSVKLIGGFNSCTDAENNTLPSFVTKTVIQGVANNTLPTAFILGSTERSQLTFENLIFRDSSQGILAVNTDARIELNNVDITGNDNGPNAGAGLAILNGSTVDLIATDTYIVNNRTANDGGGIYCNGNSRVDISGNSGISGNTSDGNGGGAAILNDCELLLSSNAFATSIAPLAGVQGNEAENGGGIYVSDAVYYHTGYLTGPAAVIGNTAINDGGGVFATGENALVVFDTGIIQGNSAGVDGGGIYADFGADVQVGFKLLNANPFNNAKACWSPGKCMQINANESRFGGAIYAETDGQVTVNRAYIEGNRGDFGVIGYAFERGSLDIKGTIMNNNGNGGIDNGIDRDDISLFYANSASESIRASIDLFGTTIADNNFVNDVFRNLNGRIFTRASIISESVANNIYNPNNDSDQFFGCMLVHEDGSLVNTENITIADPQFVDRANGDYHLSGTSPAIDLCGDSNLFDGFDIDLDVRSFDDPTTSNGAGPADAGADETYINDTSDIIFANGFD